MSILGAALHGQRFVASSTSLAYGSCRARTSIGPVHIRQIAKARTHRIVVVLDIFEDWPTYEWPRRNSPEQYVKFLLDVRRETAGTKDEVVILLFNHSEAFEKAGHSLNEQMLEQLSHCCSFHGDLEGAVFENEASSDLVPPAARSCSRARLTTAQRAGDIRAD